MALLREWRFLARRDPPISLERFLALSLSLLFSLGSSEQFRSFLNAPPSACVRGHEYNRMESTFNTHKGLRDAAGYAQSARSDCGIQRVGTHSYVLLRALARAPLSNFSRSFWDLFLTRKINPE